MFEQITHQYPYKTELHAHSFPVSACGCFSPQEVVDIYRGVGCDTLVLTNHLTAYHLRERSEKDAAQYYLEDYYKALDAASGKDINVALGVEIRFVGTSNDYLVYGVCPDDIEVMASFVKTDIQTFWREFKNERNVIIHAHPFRNDMEPTPIGCVDGVETFNTHVGHNSRIAYACRLAREHGFLVTGGSDFHEQDRHATCLVRTKNALRDSYDVAAAIKSRDILFDVFGHIVVPYANS